MRAWLLNLLFRLLRAMPWALLKLKGRALGFIWTHILPLRNRVMHQNLQKVFPDSSKAWRRRVIRRCKFHFAMTGLELLWLPRMDQQWVAQHVHFRNRDLPARLLEKGKGVVCVGGHFGSWEVMGAATSQIGYPLSYIVKRINDPLLDKLINDSRRSTGVEIIYTREAGRQVLRHLKRNRMLAFLSDQDARSRGIFVDFLGSPASTPMGAAIYALRLRAPMMFVHDLRLPNGDHEVNFHEIPIPEDMKLNDKNVHALTQQFTDLMSAEVRRTPEQWFWMHKRWKTTPLPEQK